MEPDAEGPYNTGRWHSRTNDIASDDFLPLKKTFLESETVRIVYILPSWTIKSNRVVLAIGSTWCKVDAGANLAVFMSIAAYTIAMGVMTCISIISSADGLGAVGSAQEIGFHGDADVFLDLVVLTGTVAFQAGQTISEKENDNKQHKR